jgi:hypothetical protein
MLTSDFTTMIAALAATSLQVGFHLGPIFAIAWTAAKPSTPGAGPLAVGNDALKNDFDAQAVSYSLLSAAVTTTVGAPVLHLGGGIDSERYSVGELVRSARRVVPSHCFCSCFYPGRRRGGRIRCRSDDPYVIYITDDPAKNRPKSGRMKPFCRNRETILKHTGRTSLANRGRQRCPGGIT